MKKKNVKSLKLHKSSISNLSNTTKGGIEVPIRITRINQCGSQIDACPSALACTFQANCPITFEVNCQTLNNMCPSLNYPCQSLPGCA